MTDRIMVKIASVEQGFYFRTISREYRSLKNFYFTEDSFIVIREVLPCMSRVSSKYLQ